MLTNRAQIFNGSIRTINIIYEDINHILICDVGQKIPLTDYILGLNSKKEVLVLNKHMPGVDLILENMSEVLPKEYKKTIRKDVLI